MRVLVIGGTAFLGNRLVPELVKAGHGVTILHRKPKHGFGKKVDNIQADRNDAAQMKQALEGRRFEIVFDNAYDWERGTNVHQIEGTIHALGDRITRYIYMSSISTYGDGLNHYEDDPLAPDDAQDNYVRNKAMTERMLFRMHQRNGFPVVTFRPPFIYGPENPFYREAFFWDRLRVGRPLILPGDGGRLMQFVYIKDLITAMLKSMTDSGAIGEAFNIGMERPVTQLELLQALAKAAKKKLTTVKIPRDRIAEAGGNATGEATYFGELFDLPPITEAMGKLKRVLKLVPTPFDAGLHETYLWYQRQKKPAKLHTEFEDKLIEMAANGIPIPADI